MKKKLLFVPVLLAGLLASCGENPNPPTPTDVKVTSVSLSETSKVIEVGEEFDLTATVKPDNATNKAVTWSSSKESVAKYNAGKVKGLAEGETVITVTTEDQNKTASCNVTVWKQGELIHVESISLDKTSLEMKKGETVTLVASILPANASVKTVDWDSDNNSVATVENGKITTKSAGNCVITATSRDMGFNAYCEVTVTEEVTPDPDPEIETSTVTIDTYEFTYSHGTSLNGVSTVVGDNTITPAKADGSNDPIYAKDGKITSIRLYPGNTMSIANKIGNITKIVFEFESKHDSSSLGISADLGTFTTDTWTGASKQVLFRIAAAGDGKRAVAKLTVTYEKSSRPHDPIDLGTKTIKEVKDYILNEDIPNPIEVNSHNCGIDKYVTVTIKGFALAKISLIKTAKDFGLNVSEPSKIIMGDDTDAIGCATKTGEGSFFNKVNDHQMKDTSRYTVSGYISIYLGQPEIVVTGFEWDQNLDVSLDIDTISKDNISITEFYEKAAAVNYNCAGHGYGEVYTIKGLTCYYDESAGQGKDWYNFTDGTQNIRVNAYNLGSVSVGATYDVTGIISLQNLSPIIVAFKFEKSDATPVDLNEFYKSATAQSITDLLKIKGSQDDTDTRYPDVVKSYAQISKATGYMCIVEENGKLYVGFSDAYKGEKFIVGKDNAKANYGVTLIKNDGFWNTTEEKLALFNVYYDVMCENIPVNIYYVNRQLGYKQNKPMWEILLVPQSIPVPAEE